MLSELSHLLLLVGVWKLEELLVSGFWHGVTEVVVSITSDSSSEVHILLHDGNSVGVDGTKVGILENSDQVGLGTLLESLECVRGKSEVAVNTGGNRLDESHEWSSWDHVGHGFLVLLDLSEGNSSWLESDLSLLTISFLDSLGSSGGLLSWSSSLGLGGNFGGSVLLFWHFDRLTFKF